jgi:hypothetical protein
MAPGLSAFVWSLYATLRNAILQNRQLRFATQIESSADYTISMNRLRMIPWSRAAAEIAIIVVGILLAFWLEAWWETNKEGDFRQTLLSSVLEELRQTQTSLNWQEPFLTAIRESARQLVIASNDTESILSDREIDKLLYEICFYENGASLVTPELTAVISGGHLSLVHDNQLRILLSSWPARLEAHKRNLSADFDFFNNTQVKYLMHNAELRQIYIASNSTPGLPQTWPIEDVEIDGLVSHADMIHDREFRNIVTERINLLSVILDAGNQLQNLRDNVAKMIDGVERELRR